ncbi:MAG: AAA family ATPase [Firmicutes bacterium]|nr:AAA family ATPase [Bacillota bacterium]
MANLQPALRDSSWLQAQWEFGHFRARDAGEQGALLVLDEIHKLTGWSEVVKRLWDEDTASGVRLKVMLLGSSPFLVSRGLSDSLTGRFELNRVSHWSYGEIREAFGWRRDAHRPSEICGWSRPATRFESETPGPQYRAHDRCLGAFT